jgi:hypothetical protein
MKLISVQSRGNRLVTVLKHSQVEGVGGFTIWLKTFNKKEKAFKKCGLWHREWKYDALKAAETWLEGASNGNS